MDTWDKKQIKTLELGGNLRFKNMLNEYQIPEKSDPEFIYFIYATDYYRKLLKSEVTGEESPIKPDLLQGLEIRNPTIEKSNKI